MKKLELLYYYLNKAKWCINNSSDPINATNAYLNCVENVLQKIKTHEVKCDNCGKPCENGIDYLTHDCVTYSYTKVEQ